MIVKDIGLLLILSPIPTASLYFFIKYSLINIKEYQCDHKFIMVSEGPVTNKGGRYNLMRCDKCGCKKLYKVYEL